MRSEAYVEELRREFPGLRLVDKSGDRLSWLIAGLLRLVTLGAQRRYLTHYVTTLGQVIYLPAGWATQSDASRYVTLRHEAVHLRQFRRLGLVRMALIYGLIFLPFGLAWGRARLEWEAYAETLRATAEIHGIEAAMAPGMRAHITAQFTGGAYGWMWPFPRQVERWIDAEIETIRLSANLSSC